jgi:hypothetical protein
VIGRDLHGGSISGTADLNDSGLVRALGRIANITIGGSLIAGTDNTTGLFQDNGAIRAGDDIGSVTIRGGIIGNATNPAIISARGQVLPTSSDVAIGSLRVLGRVEFAHIVAGVNAFGQPRNADAQIGSVVVVGEWIASNLVAGAVAGADGTFGTADDAKMSGGSVKDEAGINSKIASVTIGGQVLGTVGGTDHFGIVAEQIGAVKIGGTPLALTAGIGNDDIPLGITGDFRIKEI